MYNEFETGNESLVHGTPLCKWDEKKTTLTAALNPVLTKYESIKDDIEHIAKAWCSIINGAQDQSEGGKKMEGDFYYLFYYWLGDKVWKSERESKPFSDVMNEIYTALKEVHSSIQYGEICTKDIDQSTFNEMKLAYEYYMDHEKIKEQLEGAKREGYPCTVQYSELLDKTVSAYNNVYGSLHGEERSGNRYCDKFKEMFNHYDTVNPQEIKCENVYTEKSTADIGTTAAISSIVGIGALPTIAYLLYKVSKYNILPSWISNHFGGGNSNRNRTNRKKRTIENDFDTLTDTSTLYSTDLSTTSTEDNSTIYNEREEQTIDHNNKGNHNRDKDNNKSRRQEILVMTLH
ncbi:KIR-like protein [Plasmodium coatneyi]|uniref:KIR-like protein n=1 Tax=Plasmodium coatneyi TaxID=208452 RepID=A0A1B1DWR1_9APIC|nr:KIR-like protein [Plasmodium coatneyi]ANQ07198.1 KIR-like protein [Plasmodium coatneyi]